MKDRKRCTNCGLTINYSLVNTTCYNCKQYKIYKLTFRELGNSGDELNMNYICDKIDYVLDLIENPINNDISDKEKLKEIFITLSEIRIIR